MNFPCAVASDDDSCYQSPCVISDKVFLAIYTRAQQIGPSYNWRFGTTAGAGNAEIMFHYSRYCLFLTPCTAADMCAAHWYVTGERAWSLIYVGVQEWTSWGKEEKGEKGVGLHPAEKWPAHPLGRFSLRWPAPFVPFMHVCVRRSSE